MKKHPFLKSVSILLCLVLTATNCVLAYAPETNFWKERRLTLSTRTSYVVPRTPITSTTYDVRRTPFPSGATRRPVIFHIQDIHQNLEAQTDIARRILELTQQHKIDLIALEAAVEPLDLDRFRKFDDREAVKIVSDYLLKEGKISGPAYVGLTGPIELPPFVGVDDRDHYRANVQTILDSAEARPKSKEQITNEIQILKTQKEKTYSSELKWFDDEIEKYRAGNISFGSYVRLLQSRRPSLSPELKKFAKALQMENSFDWEKVERERDQFLRQPNPSLLHRYPSLKAYIDYVNLSESINGERLFKEVRETEKSIYASLAHSKREKELVDKSRRLHLSGKLVDFALTKDEWAEYKGVRSAWSVVHGPRKIINESSLDYAQRTTDYGLKSFERFYEEAETRDRLMAENLARAMKERNAKKVILVTGGFHAEGIAEYLNRVPRTANREAKIISIIPKITQSDSFRGSQDAVRGSSYLSLFARQKTPLEELFKGQKLFLAKPPMPAELLAAGAAAQVALVQEARSPLDFSGEAETMASLASVPAQFNAQDTQHQTAEGFLAIGGKTIRMIQTMADRGITGYREDPYERRALTKSGFAEKWDVFKNSFVDDHPIEWLMEKYDLTEAEVRLQLQHNQDWILGLMSVSFVGVYYLLISLAPSPSLPLALSALILSALTVFHIIGPLFHQYSVNVVRIATGGVPASKNDEHEMRFIPWSHMDFDRQLEILGERLVRSEGVRNIGEIMKRLKTYGSTFWFFNSSSEELIGVVSYDYNQFGKTMSGQLIRDEVRVDLAEGFQKDPSGPYHRWLLWNELLTPGNFFPRSVKTIRTKTNAASRFDHGFFEGLGMLKTLTDQGMARFTYSVPDQNEIVPGDFRWDNKDFSPLERIVYSRIDSWTAKTDHWGPWFDEARVFDDMPDGLALRESILGTYKDVRVLLQEFPKHNGGSKIISAAFGDPATPAFQYHTALRLVLDAYSNVDIYVYVRDSDQYSRGFFYGLGFVETGHTERQYFSDGFRDEEDGPVLRDDGIELIRPADGNYEGVDYQFPAFELSLLPYDWYRKYFAGLESFLFLGVLTGLTIYGMLQMGLQADDGKVLAILWLGMVTFYNELFIWLHKIRYKEKYDAIKADLRFAARQIQKVYYLSLIGVLVLGSYFDWPLWLPFIVAGLLATLAHYTNDWIYQKKPVLPGWLDLLYWFFRLFGARLGKAELSLIDDDSPVRPAPLVVYKSKDEVVSHRLSEYLENKEHPLWGTDIALGKLDEWLDGKIVWYVRSPLDAPDNPRGFLVYEYVTTKFGDVAGVLLELFGDLTDDLGSSVVPRMLQGWLRMAQAESLVGFYYLHTEGDGVNPYQNGFLKGLGFNKTTPKMATLKFPSLHPHRWNRSGDLFAHSKVGRVDNVMFFESSRLSGDVRNRMRGMAQQWFVRRGEGYSGATLMDLLRQNDIHAGFDYSGTLMSSSVVWREGSDQTAELLWTGAAFGEGHLGPSALIQALKRNHNKIIAFRASDDRFQEGFYEAMGFRDVGFRRDVKTGSDVTVEVEWLPSGFKISDENIFLLTTDATRKAAIKWYNARARWNPLYLMYQRRPELMIGWFAAFYEYRLSLDKAAFLDAHTDKDPTEMMLLQAGIEFIHAAMSTIPNPLQPLLRKPINILAHGIYNMNIVKLGPAYRPAMAVADGERKERKTKEIVSTPLRDRYLSQNSRANRPKTLFMDSRNGIEVWDYVVDVQEMNQAMDIDEGALSPESETILFRGLHGRNITFWQRRILFEFLVRNNFGLVVYFLKRFPSGKSEDLESILKSTLTRGVQRFKFWQGIKFSTYIFSGLLRSRRRHLTREKRHHKKMARIESREDDGEFLSQVADSYMVNPELLDFQFYQQRFNLLSRERQIILKLRFGLGSDRDYTLEETEEKIGTTGEDVRLKQERALKSLKKGKYHRKPAPFSEDHADLFLVLDPNYAMKPGDQYFEELAAKGRNWLEEKGSLTTALAALRQNHGEGLLLMLIVPQLQGTSIIVSMLMTGLIVWRFRHLFTLDRNRIPVLSLGLEHADGRVPPAEPARRKEPMRLEEKLRLRRTFLTPA